MLAKTFMRRLRAVASGLVSAVLSFWIVSASGCGTDAVGVEDCRRIEQARCAAAAPCGEVDDVDACQRFYRDQCLHGVSGRDPGPREVDACVTAIEAAGRCARSDADAPLESCDSDAPDPAPNLETACDVVLYPERAEACSFLLDSPEPPAPSGGQGGDTSGGSEPQAGAAGGS